jgi:hypothetical protein
VQLGGIWTGIIITQVALTVIFVPIAIVFGLQTWKVRKVDHHLPAGAFLSVRLEMDGDSSVARGCGRRAAVAAPSATAADRSGRAADAHRVRQLVPRHRRRWIDGDSPRQRRDLRGDRVHVARRTREIGLRVAVGATPAQIVAVILSRTARHVAIGVLVGAFFGSLFANAFAGGSLRLSLLEGGAFLVAYVSVMLGVCLVAAIVPTRRALAIQPTRALAAE